MTTATSRPFLFSEATSGEADMDMFNGLPAATTITTPSRTTPPSCTDSALLLPILDYFQIINLYSLPR